MADDVPIEQSATLAVEPLYLNELPANQGDRRDEDWKSAENGANGWIRSPSAIQERPRAFQQESEP